MGAPYNPGFAAFGGGSTGSILHPIVLAAAIALSISIWVLPRKYIIFPLFLGILLIPSGQNIKIGAHVYVYRILILAGWARLAASRLESGKLLPQSLTLDKVFFLWAVYRFLASTFQFGDVGAVIYQAALLFDSLGGYFLFRSLVRDEEDVRRVVKAFMVVALVSAAVMVRELATGENVMGLLGGIRAISDIRNGRIRAQGVFQHSILAGSFGATTAPLFLWMWLRGSDKFAAAAGAISSCIMVFACASSTPVSALLGIFAGVCLWPLRDKMRLVRRAIAFVLFALAITMKAPIWYILARIDFAGGSSGWERAFLIDTFCRHWRDWWLIGTHANGNWGWDMWDQANQFVSEGESGGLVALACFVALIVICFRIAGDNRRRVQGNLRKEFQYWLLGTAMFAQVLIYMGVDYFDQSKFVWYAMIAIFPAVAVIARAATAPRESLWLLPDEASSVWNAENALDREVRELPTLIATDNATESGWGRDSDASDFPHMVSWKESAPAE